MNRLYAPMGNPTLKTDYVNNLLENPSQINVLSAEELKVLDKELSKLIVEQSNATEQQRLKTLQNIVQKELKSRNGKFLLLLGGAGLAAAWLFFIRKK